MTRLIFLSFSLLITYLLSGQQSSQFLAQWYSSNSTGNVTVSHSAQGPSGEFVIAGEYTNGVQFGSNIQTNASHDNYLMKTDTNGNHQWTLTFGNKSYMFVQQIEVADDGSIFISGNFRDSISVQGYSLKDAGLQPFLWKINPAGNFEYALDFRSNPNSVTRPRFSVDNGELTVTVIANDSLNYGPATLLPNRSSNEVGFMGRYNYQGNLLGFETFDSPDYFFLREPVRLGTNQIIQQVSVDGSDSLFFGSTYFAGNSKKGTWFFELDSTFQVVKNHFIEYTGFAGFSFKGLSSTNELMYTGTFSGTITDGSLSVQNLDAPANPFSLSDGVFMVMSQNLVPILLESTGVKGDNDNITGAVELGGHYFLSGSAGGDLLYRGDTILKATTAQSQGFVLEMDKNGVQKSLVHTSNPSIIARTIFSGIFPVNKTTYAVCGSATVSSVFNGTDTLNRQSFMDGFIWSFTDQRLSLNSLQASEPAFSLYPNPSRGILNIQHQLTNTTNWEIRGYNLNGTLVIETSATQSAFDVSALKPGCYIFELKETSTQQTVRQRVIME